MGEGGGSTIFPKIATGLLIIAFLFHLIAIGSNWWAVAPVPQRMEHIGLWRYCSGPYDGGESCGDFVNIIYSDWLKAAQAFWILGMFAVPAAIGVVGIYAFVPDFQDDMRVMGAAMGMTGFAGLLNLVAVCTFGDRFQEYFNNKDPENWAGKNVGQLDWSFGLASTDMILCFIALGLLVLDLYENQADVQYEKS